MRPNPPPPAEPLSSGDLDRVAATLASAFREDPIFVWLLPRPTLRTNLENAIQANARGIEVQTTALERMLQFPLSATERAHYEASLRRIHEYLAANHYPP